MENSLSALYFKRTADFFCRAAYTFIFLLILLVCLQYAVRGPHRLTMALLCALGLTAGVALLRLTGLVGARLGPGTPWPCCWSFGLPSN